MITNGGVHMVPGKGVAPSARDIAIGMCRITRYAGALWMPLSAHSILVADLAFLESKEPIDWAMGLLHDAHETVTGEVTRQWKPQTMKERERELDDRIFTAFNLNADLYRSRKKFFKSIDEKALTAEVIELRLPGWPGIYFSENGKTHPVLGNEEWAIAKSIINSDWRNPTAIRENSVQIQALEGALHNIKKGDYEAARLEVSPS